MNEIEKKNSERERAVDDGDGAIPGRRVSRTQAAKNCWPAADSTTPPVLQQRPNHQRTQGRIGRIGKDPVVYVPDALLGLHVATSNASRAAFDARAVADTQPEIRAEANTLLHGDDVHDTRLGLRLGDAQKSGECVRTGSSAWAPQHHRLSVVFPPYQRHTLSERPVRPDKGMATYQKAVSERGSARRRAGVAMEERTRDVSRPRVRHDFAVACVPIRLPCRAVRQPAPFSSNTMRVLPSQFNHIIINQYAPVKLNSLELSLILKKYNQYEARGYSSEASAADSPMPFTC
ncbi:hypothetical protein C8J57DRAFT_1472738 [Mycena rebaudengoi]|nr:hypothetical protein C8J57DRAFT_1472738 [Mycena rebaudengoi]